MTIYGILCGYTDFTNLADFLNVYEDYFTTRLKLENGTPSYHTLPNVFAIIDSQKFLEVFIEWIKGTVKDNGAHLSIDEKQSRVLEIKIFADNFGIYGKIPMGVKYFVKTKYYIKVVVIYISNTKFI